MKKIILLLMTIGTFSAGLRAQGLYFNAGAGYGFRAGSMIMGIENNADGSSKVIRGSYGVGFTPNLAVGLMISPNVGAELGLGYLIGKRTKVADDFGTSQGDTRFSGNVFYLNPSLVLRSGSTGTIVPYAKLGVFLGLANSAMIKTHTDTYDGGGDLTDTDDSEFKYKGNISTGVTSVLGADFMISDNLAVFGELNARMASWKPGSYTMHTTSTDYVGGVAEPSTEFSVSGNFMREIPDNYTGTDLPMQILPLSSIGISLGIRIYMSK